VQKCGSKLFSGHPEDVDGGFFDRQIAQSTLPVLLDVWALGADHAR
jgi:thioredoxin 2